MRVLVVAEHVDGRVADVTYELISAASGLGEEVVVAAVSREPCDLDLDREGVDTVVRVHVDNAEFQAEVYQAALESLLIEQAPQVVLLGFTPSSMGYASAVAAVGGVGFASDVVEIRRVGDAIGVTSSFYGGKVWGELDFPAERPVLLLLRPKVWPAAQRPGLPTVVDYHLGPVASRPRHRSFRAPMKADVDITTADFVLAIGRGVGERANLETFAFLADRLGATLAVSRPLVDAGWISNTLLVGRSRNTVRPKVYLAFGISGASQHVAGMSSSKLIIAVNTDPEAAIFDVAHYGATTNLFAVAEELAKLV